MNDSQKNAKNKKYLFLDHNTEFDNYLKHYNFRMPQRELELRRVFQIIRDNSRGNSEYKDFEAYCSLKDSLKDYLRLSKESLAFLERIYPCDDPEILELVYGSRK